MKIYKLLFCTLFFSFFKSASFQSSCLNEKGEPLDWFLLFKIPELKSFPNSNVSTGYAYIILTSTETTFRLSEFSIADERSAVGQTLLSSKDSRLLYMSYNNENPNGFVYTHGGHTKGVLAFNETLGFWLIHSVPKFPSLSQKYSYPSSGALYGQSFLCVSFPLSELENIGQQLLINQPHVLHCVLPSWIPRSSFPSFQKSCLNIHQNSTPDNRFTKILSLHGTLFESFAKSSSFHKDLYAELLAPKLQSDLLVESWNHGVEPLESVCNVSYKVQNVIHIRYKDKFDFLRSKDHSKWTIGVNGFWICVGDINRMKSQLSRGGGSLCFSNQHVWKALSDSIIEIEPCPDFNKDLFNLL